MVDVVDFDVSMSNHITPGALARNPYKPEDFSQWEILKRLYITYNPNNVKPSSELRIPKIIHQIWLGSHFPKHYERYQKSWLTYHPGWLYKLWTDADVKNFTWSNQNSKKLFDDAQNYGEKSDILRYELLYRYGGLYVDVDFECLKPLDDLHYCYDVYVGIEQAQRLEINNALIGAAPEHPFLKFCIESLRDQGSKRDFMAIMQRSGPVFFTKCFMHCIALYEDSMFAFPVSYFYPIPIKTGAYHTLNQVANYIQPETYAVHYWNSSWTLPSGFVKGSKK